MLKAVLHNGEIVPLEPLPPEWEEGTTLEVASVNPSSLDIDDWPKRMNELCAEVHQMMKKSCGERSKSIANIIFSSP